MSKYLLNVGIHYPYLAAFEQLFDSCQGLLCAPSRSKPIALVGEVAFQNGFAHVFECRLHPAESSLRPNPVSGIRFVTDWQFTFGCSPRSHYCAAVTFRHRPGEQGLTGTFTPLCWCESQSH